MPAIKISTDSVLAVGILRQLNGLNIHRPLIRVNGHHLFVGFVS
jgi:hypothetical protein